MQEHSDTGNLAESGGGHWPAHANDKVIAIVVVTLKEAMATAEAGEAAMLRAVTGEAMEATMATGRTATDKAATCEAAGKEAAETMMTVGETEYGPEGKRMPRS